MREEIIITEQIVSDWLSKRLHYYKVLYSLSFKINEERERERENSRTFSRIWCDKLCETLICNFSYFFKLLLGD